MIESNMENVKQYVLRVCDDNYLLTSGVLVGHYFITVGHSIKSEYHPYIKINNKKILLDDPIFFSNGESAEDYDLAVFDIPDVNSPLLLSAVVPSKDNILECYSWDEFLESTRCIECSVKASDFPCEGNYFFADTDIVLHEGSSGSPVFLDNKVVGILVRGDADAIIRHSLCAFLSGAAIQNIINKLTSSKE